MNQKTLECDPTWVGRSGHDFNSPSQLDLNACCPGRPNLERQTEKTSIEHSTKDAQRGTNLWALLVEVLEGKKEFDTLKSECERDDFEQLSLVRTWILNIIDEVKHLNPIVTYEMKVDLSMFGISGGKHGSRADVHILLPGIGSIVIDVKLGIRYVSPPQWNRQFKAYGTAVQKYFGGNVECIKLQPQSEEEYQITRHVFEETDFEEIDKDITQIVLATREPDAPIVRGPHCTGKFCGLRHGVCPLWKNSLLEIPKGVRIPEYFERLSPIERKEFYEMILTAKSVVAQAEKAIDEMVLNNGVVIEGYEKGEGRPSYIVANENKAEKVIMGVVSTLQEKGRCEGVTAADLYEPRKMKSRSSIKKLTGSSKAINSIIDPLYVVTPGNPKIVKKRG